MRPADHVDTERVTHCVACPIPGRCGRYGLRHHDGRTFCETYLAARAASVTAPAAMPASTGSGAPAAESAAAAGVAVAPAAGSARDDASLARVRDAIARVRRARACPHRIDPQRCNCSQIAVCSVGRGDLSQGQRASLTHCMACVVTLPDASPSTTTTL